MAKKIIIKESQVEALLEYINGQSLYVKTVNKIEADLNLNYSHEVGTYRSGGEYFEKPMIRIKADNEMISPKALFEYLSYKYKLGNKFLQQVILDWLNDKIHNGLLSKNVPLDT